MKPEGVPYFRYPWDGLQSYLESIDTDHLRLLTYGSLMNRESASITMLVTADTSFVPAIGYGIKRVFNHRMPEQALTRHGFPVSTRHVAALNVVSTNNVQDSVNGLLLRIDVAHIPGLRDREIGYDLAPITAEMWEDREPVSEPVFVLEHPIIDKGLLPHLQYLKICESGVRSLGAAFLDDFRRTTFLADGTPLTGWNREHNG
uniref:Gamma-glutamyl cyclotransferase, AIG2-like n=1 Tax=Candidatus Kentrum eta TaxID=2126337 RepID=A0A450VAM5_9GAMM|nr:MAG: hypothetical protein BECKH772B_GA0070898_102114 [Candidatus Kentron sp. H]VFK01835.1 MAG: hypothetical protein BECKH772A_GA0070896_102434 [Candidatus Kentron sp. H]VFK05208.1 MAG: hypothetical protein BECKH772C_GA0070978_102474 [Candidatus Kentron sp. H]